MRLRLRIERNELPAVSVLWTIEPTELKQTVAQFLQRVDERVPLEGESWGLEDYAVTVGGYEAFHYSEVGQSFQNEDEVIIKPLQYVDVRARTITGRDQITSDGRHLLDGIPFGKPLLKRARRPGIFIPPRKRQRLEVEDDAPLPITAGTDEDYGEWDEEEDTDFQTSEEEAEDGAEKENDGSDESEESEEDEAPTIPRRTRRQRLIDDEAEELGEHQQESGEGSSENDDSSDDDSESESSEDSSDTSESDSSDDDASSESSWNGIETSPNKGRSTPLLNGNAEEEGTSTSSSSTGKITTSPPKIPEIPHSLEASNSGLPHQGLSDTKLRNIRRREQRKLKYLKEAGLLDSSADMNLLRDWKKTHGASTGPEVTRAAESLKAQQKKNTTDGEGLETARQRLVESIAGGGVDVSEEAVLTNGRRTKRNKGHVEEEPVEQDEQDEQDEAPEEESSAAPTARMNGLIEQPANAESADTSASRRARINLAGVNRLVFGSLGQRTPKTQADKDALQKKLSSQSSRNIPPKDANPPAHDEVEDPEAWQDKIQLSAVECCDEGVELSAPPFPFQQRWDPQYQFNKKRKKSGNSDSFKSRKTANGSVHDYVESYDKYNTNGEGDALNYDDPEDDAEDDSYWEEGALLGDDGDDTDEKTPDDGFPLLPTDLNTLSTIVEGDAREGDIVTFKELVCSAATKWTPTHLNRTVRLESKNEEGSWVVTFATRDKRPKQYDDEGNRVYSKFEMEGLSDDEGEEDENNVLEWSLLSEPRLLQRAAAVEASE